jgi:DnaJ-related protein SCJ1
MVHKKILCDHCRGSGAASDGDIHQCSGCQGSGVKIVKQQVPHSLSSSPNLTLNTVQIFPGMFAQSQMTCDNCGGRGKIIAKKCGHCGGAKVIDHTQHLTLEITPGHPEGKEVVFEGEADESPDWEPGDVVLRVRSRKNKGGWRRKETSLYWRETIGIDEVGLFTS